MWVDERETGIWEKEKEKEQEIWRGVEVRL